MERQFKEGDRVVWNGGQGTFLRYSDDGQTGYLHWDEDRREDGTFPFEQEDIASEIAPLVLLTVEDVAFVGELPSFSFGHVITEDGTIYSLTTQYAHGIVCAILFPDVAKAAGFAPPARGAANVYEYQRFELDHHDALPVVRIAFGMAGTYLSKSKKAATPEQIDAARRCLLARGMNLNDDVTTDDDDVSVRRALKDLTESYE